VDGIMTAHIAMTGIEGADARPATLSRTFGTELLREEMGFGGLLFTDAMDMGAIAKRFGTSEPLLMALDAGADVLLMPVGVTQAINTVVAAVESGRIAEARIDTSVRRILAAKVRAGVHRERQVDLLALDRAVGVRAHREVAQTIAERSLTLVRDEGNRVPARGVRRVVSITYAREGDAAAGRHFHDALRERGLEVRAVRVDDRSTAEELAAARALADGADLVVVGAYVSPREHAGTVGAEGGVPRFVERLAAEGAPVVVVSFGSPYLLSFFPSIPSYLVAWGGAEVSQRAAVRALLGERPITGTLPISLPPNHAIGTGINRPAAGGE
jgi:beta-N-acetylhexosaminidase